MADVFDQVADAPAPAGDVFDQVAPDKGDVFDEVAKAPLRRQPLDAYQQAQLSGASHQMDAHGADFLTAVANDPKGFLKSLPASAQNVVEQAGAGALNLPARVYRAVAGTPQVGVIGTDDQGNQTLTSQPKPLPFQANQPLLPSDANALQPEGSDLNRLVGGFTTPGMVATLPWAATKPMQAYFLAQTSAGAVDAAGRLLDPASDRRQAIQDLMLNGAMAAGLGAHMAKGEPAADGGARLSERAGEPGETPASPNVETPAVPSVASVPVLLPEPKSDVFDQVTDGPAAVRANPAEPPKVPEGWDIHSTPHGIYVYDPDRISPEEIEKALPPAQPESEPLGNSEQLPPAAVAAETKPAESETAAAELSGNSGELPAAAAVDKTPETTESNPSNDSATIPSLGGAGAPTAPEVYSDVLRRGAEAVRSARPTATDYSAGFEALVDHVDGHFIKPDFLSRPPDATGQEHNVWHGDDGRTYKATFPNEFGDAINGRATPQSYFDRLALNNEVFGDDLRVAGVANQGGKLRVITSQPTLKAVGPVTESDVHTYLEGHGFRDVDVNGQQVWWNPDRKVMAFDAHNGNFIKTELGPRAIDVNLQRPDAAMQGLLQQAKPVPDKVESWLMRGIDATNPDNTKLLDGVTGAPIWMSQAAVNLTLKAALHTYRYGRDLGKAVATGLAWLRAQQLPGYDEGQAREWVTQAMEHTAAGQTEGRLFGGATNELRPIEATRPDDWSTVNATTTEPLLSDLHSLVTGAGWRQRAENAKAWLGGLAGQTFPRTTRAARAVGEQMARWIASRQAAQPLADGLVDDVLRGLDIDDEKFGAALHEDNLRSIQQRLLKQADAAGKTDPDKAFNLRRQANNVFTFVGDKGVFKDEDEYQNFLSHPRVQTAVRRYKDLRSRLIEPMYLEAMKLDPSLQLDPRGMQTGARINLNWVNPGELRGPGVYESNPTPRGKLSNVLTKSSPFGRVATGNAVAYRPSFRDSIRNTYAKQLEIANRNKCDRLLVANGHAIEGKPGLRPTVQGESTVPFEQRRQTLMIDKNGSITRVPINQNLYVRKSLAGEYARALNLDRPAGDQLTIVKALNKFANTAALSGLTDVSAHVSNLSHALFTRPGVSQKLWREIGLSVAGRADIGFALARAMKRFSDTDHARLRELATIGALREPHPEGSKWNPMRFGAALIQTLDTRTRLQLDRMYGNLRDQGLVQDSETARREFINQVGQYNKRAQGPMMRWFRDTGLGPFATAGRAFNVLGVRTATLNPGAPATTPAARVALAAAMASKIAGTALLIGTANYVLTRNQGGGALGRPGVRIGTVDLGVDDKNGRPMTLDLANLLGLGRAARVTGIRGALESSRNNLPLGTVIDSSYRDIVNSWISPFAGPTLRAGMIAATGQQPAIAVPPTAPRVPPGQSQALENVKTAAIELSPITAGIHDSMQPGATGWEWAQKQAGRFTLQPGKAPSMMANYPQIVDRAQASAFMDDVVRRARNMAPDARMDFLRASISRLQPADQKRAWETVKYRKVMRR